MPCFHLNAIQRLPYIDFDGNARRTFLGKARNLNPKKYPLDSIQLVPCRQCIGCRLENFRQWATRLIHETKSHYGSCFLTLTYDPKKLPVDGSLKKAHLQSFFKRLRRRYDYLAEKENQDPKKLKFFAVGEYADPNETTPSGRPHYHAALFGPIAPFHSSGDYKLHAEEPSRSGADQFSHDDIAAVWPHGRHRLSELSFESAAYVARYCLKKITGLLAPSYYGSRQPEFQSQSNGLGKDHFLSWTSDIYPGDQVVLPERGAYLPPPYYDRLLEKADPDLFEKVKAKRKEAQEKILDPWAYERLMIERARIGEVRKLVTDATLIRGLYK